MNQTAKAAICKNSNGNYELVTNIHSMILSKMTQEQFEILIRELERLRDDDVYPNNVVCFPEFTYRITG